MAMKLVYNGSVAVSFMAIGTELNPGDTFFVPDELVDSFLQRPDIEVAIDHGMAEPDDAPTKPTRKSTVPPEPVAEVPEAE